MTHRSSLRFYTRSTHGLPARLLALSLLGAALGSGCGAKVGDNVDSTDTGNPPVIDETVLHIEQADGGVRISADPGGVSPGGSEVTVTNQTSGESESTTAGDDGAFEVVVPGTLSDGYEVKAEAAGESATVTFDENGVPSDDTAGDDVAGDPELSALIGHEYLLQSSVGFTPVPDSTVRIGFSENEFSFSANCNGHVIDYSFCADSLCTDDYFTSTLIGCGEALEGQDVWLSEFFIASPSLSLDGDWLTVTGAEATLTFLDNEVANPDRSLTGAVWNIDTLTRGGTASSIPATAEPTIEFRDDGSVQVFTSCVNGTGTYQALAGSIEFGTISYNEEGCAEGGNESVDEHIQSVIQEGEVTYVIDAARLTLDRGDVGLMAVTE